MDDSHLLPIHILLKRDRLVTAPVPLLPLGPVVAWFPFLEDATVKHSQTEKKSQDIRQNLAGVIVISKKGQISTLIANSYFDFAMNEKYESSRT